MASIFTKIIKGEIPSYKIAENDQCFAFLDINPLAKGHTLVVPKKEIDYLFDVEDELYRLLFTFSKQVAKAIEKVIPCERVGIAVLGLEVPHAHIHLIPINSIYDIEFSRPKLKLSEEEFKDIASGIRQEYEKINQ
ncbi:MAG: HIT family protein [Bacteroidales bacterium]|nr:HIT family protein [Bacteroidales bacterium]MCF8350913.1 HIT family protein [Bacteroidales bacterium]MCF8375787.1 HIT family protein [Bacteroidales bacterium]MCF8401531.1 HIT family protein [Bacteroidales bacterium]